MSILHWKNAALADFERPLNDRVATDKVNYVLLFVQITDTLLVSCAAENRINTEGR